MPTKPTLQRLRDRTLVRLRLRAPRVRVRPGRSLTTDAFVSTSGSHWDPVRLAETVDLPEPVRHGPRSIDFATRIEDIPELGVLHASHVSIVGPDGLVVTDDGYLLSDLSFWHGFPEGLKRRAPMPVKRLQGTLVSLASDHATINYGHFLMDALPRLDLLERAGVSLAAADHIYCAVPNQRAVRLLDELGIPRERRIYAEAGVAVRADLSILPSYPAGRRNYPPWVAAFLNDRLGVSARTPTRRLYVPRSAHRRISNIEELWPFLEAHGFETFDAGAEEDPRHAFAEAAVVVGGHGAGLADLAFCRPGTAVLELVPDSHPMPYYATLVGAAGLHYGYLLGEGIAPTQPLPRSRWDFRVDPDLFQRALDATVGAAG